MGIFQTKVMEEIKPHTFFRKSSRLQDNEENMAGIDRSQITMQ
jgi:hypothetical protein